MGEDDTTDEVAAEEALGEIPVSLELGALDPLVPLFAIPSPVFPLFTQYILDDWNNTCCCCCACCCWRRMPVYARRRSSRSPVLRLIT